MDVSQPFVPLGRWVGPIWLNSAPPPTHKRMYTSGGADQAVAGQCGGKGSRGSWDTWHSQTWSLPCSKTLGKSFLFSWLVLYNKPPQNLDNQGLFLFLWIGWVVPCLVSSGLIPAPVLSWNVRSNMASPMCQAIGLVVSQEALVPLQGPLLLQ